MKTRNMILRLVHWGLLTPFGVIDLGHHWLWQWLVSYSAPCHYLNQWWPIWTNVYEIWIKIVQSSFKKKTFKIFSAKCWSLCSGPNVLSRIKERCSMWPIWSNIKIRAWIRNHISIKLWYIVTHSCLNFKDGWSNLPLKIGWVITEHIKL